MRVWHKQGEAFLCQRHFLLCCGVGLSLGAPKSAPAVACLPAFPSRALSLFANSSSQALLQNLGKEYGRKRSEHWGKRAPKFTGRGRVRISCPWPAAPGSAQSGTPVPCASPSSRCPRSPTLRIQQRRPRACVSPPFPLRPGHAAPTAAVPAGPEHGAPV